MGKGVGRVWEGEWERGFCFSLHFCDFCNRYTTTFIIKNKRGGDWNGRGKKKKFTIETAIWHSFSIIFTNPQNSNEKQICFPTLPGTCPILQSIAELGREVISDLGRGAHIKLLIGKGNIDQKNLLNCILSSGGGGSNI